MHHLLSTVNPMSISTSNTLLQLQQASSLQVVDVNLSLEYLNSEQLAFSS